MSFAYHRSIAPTLGVLLALALVESMVVHLVAVAVWGLTVAVALGMVDLALVAALLALLRSIRRNPVTIADGVLTMRVGSLKTIRVPLAQIAGLRPQWDAAVLKRRDVANLALAAWPNVVIDLTTPVRVRRRQIGAIAHKLDDPVGFGVAIDKLLSSSE